MSSSYSLKQVPRWPGMLLMSCFLVASALAQQQQLEEVVVTAERRASDLQSTPVAVTAFDAEAMQELGFVRTLDIQNSVPGLTIYTGAASQSMLNVYMRGAGEQVGAQVTSESAVSFYPNVA